MIVPLNTGRAWPITRTAMRRPRTLPRELVMVSNRLPVQVSLDGDTVTLEPAAGGLASALGGLERDRTWIGWPGLAIPGRAQPAARAALRERGLAPVFLTSEDERDYYELACNETLWPLLHHVTDGLRSTPAAWRAFARVNHRFAAAIASSAGEDATVWVHDFHLMLVPALLRASRPDLRIGFFLHVPFPPLEVLRALPEAATLLEGVRGADYVGFHTAAYAASFEAASRALTRFDRAVPVGVDPIGMDVAGFESALAGPAVTALSQELELRYAGRTLLLGVERLDIMKGVPQKLLAFERFLERHPERALDTTLHQVVVPSRLSSPAVRAHRDQIELLIARINGRFGRPGVTPVEYVHRALSREELAALYRRADVMLVTSVRDGMNLVAHEFVLCQTAPGPGPAARGSLVLSEHAGAATVLPGARLVDPWRIEDIIAALEGALALPAAERTARLEAMAGRVRELECRRWADGFLAKLERPGQAARLRAA
ncbi:MAG: trehalose-6-phosphate synthase [Gaiella sp.]